MTALRILLSLLLLLPAACSRGPSNWREWIDQATTEFKLGAPGKAFDACNKAYEAAVKDGDAQQVVSAYECLEEAAIQQGKPERALPIFRTVLAKYDSALLKAGSGLRLRNNFAVTLVNQGEKAEGVAQLEAALDAYEHSVYHSSKNYRQRMLLVENLARAARVFTEEDSGIRVSSVILDEIVNDLENARYKKNFGPTIGAGDALAAIAELVRMRGDPQGAKDLAAQAKDQQMQEDDYLAGQPRRIPCDQLIIRSLVLRRCYLVLR